MKQKKKKKKYKINIELVQPVNNLKNHTTAVDSDQLAYLQTDQSMLVSDLMNSKGSISTEDPDQPVQAYLTSPSVVEGPWFPCFINFARQECFCLTMLQMGIMHMDIYKFKQEAHG